MLSSGRVFIQDKAGATKMIGIYDANARLFMSRRHSGAHKMVLRNEWGIDAQVLEHLVEADARVRIMDADTGNEYWAKAEKIKSKGRLKKYGEHGQQYFMELGDWELRSLNR